MCFSIRLTKRHVFDYLKLTLILSLRSSLSWQSMGRKPDTQTTVVQNRSTRQRKELANQDIHDSTVSANCIESVTIESHLLKSLLTPIYTLMAIRIVEHTRPRKSHTIGGQAESFRQPPWILSASPISRKLCSRLKREKGSSMCFVYLKPRTSLLSVVSWGSILLLYIQLVSGSIVSPEGLTGRFQVLLHFATEFDFHLHCSS